MTQIIWLDLFIGVDININELDQLISDIVRTV